MKNGNFICVYFITKTNNHRKYLWHEYDRVYPKMSTFSTRALIYVTKKLEVILLNQFFIKLHIEISDDTFQFLNFVIVQKHYGYFVN